MLAKQDVHNRKLEPKQNPILLEPKKIYNWSANIIRTMAWGAHSHIYIYEIGMERK